METLNYKHQDQPDSKKTRMTDDRSIDVVDLYFLTRCAE